MANKKSSINKLQVSLRSILIAVTALACLLAYIGNARHRSKKERDSARWFLSAGARIMYDTNNAETPEAIRWLRDDNLPGNVWTLNLSNTAICGSDLHWLEGLDHLRVISLSRTEVSDEDLIHIGGLDELVAIELRDTAISDGGLVHLRSLKRLQTIDLRGTRITDKGLNSLYGLSRLENIHLGNTFVTAIGVRDLKRQLPRVQVVE